MPGILPEPAHNGAPLATPPCFVPTAAPKPRNTDVCFYPRSLVYR